MFSFLAVSKPMLVGIVWNLWFDKFAKWTIPLSFGQFGCVVSGMWSSEHWHLNLKRLGALSIALFCVRAARCHPKEQHSHELSFANWRRPATAGKVEAPGHPRQKFRICAHMHFSLRPEPTPCWLVGIVWNNGVKDLQSKQVHWVADNFGWVLQVQVCGALRNVIWIADGWVHCWLHWRVLMWLCLPKEQHGDEFLFASRKQTGNSRKIRSFQAIQTKNPHMYAHVFWPQPDPCWSALFILFCWQICKVNNCIEFQTIWVRASVQVCGAVRIAIWITNGGCIVDCIGACLWGFCCHPQAQYRDEFLFASRKKTPETAGKIEAPGHPDKKIRICAHMHFSFRRNQLHVGRHRLKSLVSQICKRVRAEQWGWPFESQTVGCMLGALLIALACVCWPSGQDFGSHARGYKTKNKKPMMTKVTQCTQNQWAVPPFITEICVEK